LKQTVYAPNRARAKETALPSHAKSYDDPGTPEEQSRRQFLANATLAVGGVIGLVVAIPCAISLIPESIVNPEKGGGVWAPISPADLKSLENSSNNPVKITFSFKYQDGYLPPAPTEEFVWGVKLTPDQEATFKAKRPDLFTLPAAELPYPAVNMSFVIFSSICPHLGCRYGWQAETKRFFCPCHGSQFEINGEKIAGPAPRGLDPLPFREQNGTAEITWIQYKSGTADRIIVSYS
jgi:menaquinol-cytochrome c reductase iron-sulfur subunit